MISFEPIGYFHCGHKYRYEAPRQGVYSQTGGVIELNPGKNFEEALRDLSGFSRIWIIFCFHLNENAGWNPKVQPPVSPDERRISVFATRSPHRPNPIGMSCVSLEKIDGRQLFVGECDLLEDTPILDIKPYIPAADSFPESRTGWLEEVEKKVYSVCFSEEALKRIQFIKKCLDLDLENFCRVQLSVDPLNHHRKRLFHEDGRILIGCRTWRIEFEIGNRNIFVKDIFSGYTPEELASPEDKYGDKSVHREFREHFER